MGSGKQHTHKSVYSRINQPPAVPRRLGLRDYLPTILAVGGGTLGMACLLGLMMMVRLLPTYRADEKDMEGATLQTGVATVVSKSPVYGKMRGIWTFTFRVRNQTVPFTSENDLRAALTREGDVVSVTYKTGKSGAYYIQDWQPPAAH